MHKSIIKIIMFSTAALVSIASTAQGTDSLRDRVNSSKIHPIQQISERSSTIRKENQGVGYFDKNLTAHTFNWNNGSINKVGINKAKSLTSQHTAAFDSYFKQIAQIHGATKIGMSQAKQSNLHDTGRGGLIAQYDQKINNIEIFNRSISILINRDNDYIASSGYFSDVTKAPQSDYLLTEGEILSIAFNQNTGEEIFVYDLPQSLKSPGFKRLDQHEYSDNYRLSKDSRVKKVYFTQSDRSLTPAYYVEIFTSPLGSRAASSFSYVIDGISGKVLFKHNLTSHVDTTYKVFSDGSAKNVPLDGPIGNDLSPHPTGDIADTPPLAGSFVAPISITLNSLPFSKSNDGWLLAADTTTNGNNVNAYADIAGEDGFDEGDIRPEMTGTNAFEYEFASFADGLTGDGQKFAVVNLFYINNFLHDWFYDNGFDESSSNAQRDNYGRGGAPSDALKVEAQDFGDVNNANMTTPGDGVSPTMQMYVWTFLNDSSIDIIGVNNIAFTRSIFGVQNFDISGVLSTIDDGDDAGGTLSTTDACQAIITDLTGLIAIIDRGDCDFTVKVKHAQEQGAIGVIMANNVDDPPLITMAGDDTSITIPAILVTKVKGQEIKDALLADPTLSASISFTDKPLDGTLDNGIVAHEWAHYMSNRLVKNSSGLTNNQGRSMGEGWSDFVALLMIVKESDNQVVGNDQFQGVYSSTTFVGDAYNGIRRVPYSTDFAKNALTYKHIENGVPLPTTHPVAYGASGSSNAQVHNSGTVWANILWEVYVSLINKPGYTFDEAQNAMKDYLVAGMKLTPFAPTMLEAREALLAAALAASPEDFLLMRAAFTKRGMGASAVAPDRESDNHEGVVEDFTADVDVQTLMTIDDDSFDIGSCDNDGVLDVNETATINLTFKNYTNTALPQFDVALSTTSDISFNTSTVTVPAMAAFGDEEITSVEITVNSAAFMDEINFSAIVGQVGAGADDFIEPGAISRSILVNFDFEQTSMSDDMSSELTSEFDWTVTTDDSISSFEVSDPLFGNLSWYGPDSGAPGYSDLVTPEIKVAATGAMSISFNHFYFYETTDDADGNPVYWDGSVIEVSVGGGDWVDVIEFGATLSEAYNGIITDTNDALAGRNAYVATREVGSTVMSPNTLTFPDGLVNGQNIRVRFRIGTDVSVGDFGWLIDDVVITNAINNMFSDIVVEDNSCLVGTAPTVNAGDDIVQTVPSSGDVTVNLTGTASDVDGDDLTVLWTQRAGPTVVIDNATSLAASFTMAIPSADASMVFEMTVSDGNNTSSDVVNVLVQLNTPPTVTASDLTIREGQSASITATGSDAEGDALTYSWTQTSGPSVALSGADTATATFTAPQVTTGTTLTFDVVANDGTVNSATATSTVTVTNTPPAPPTTSGGGGGGGSLPIWLVAALGLLVGAKRRRTLS